MVGHLPLAALAYSALYNKTYATWKAAYDARMQFAPVAPNITYANITNSTNQSIVYMYDGKEVLYRALRKCTLRSGRSLTSDSVGTLERGEEVRATKHACECPQRLSCPGWIPIDVL